VHVLPSWFETCGLATLEAAACGCNVVVTDKGYVREFIGDAGYYCDPGNPASIREAIERAAAAPLSEHLKQKIACQYTWEQAAGKTSEAYRQILTPEA
jgi:glycosyltransferase involved in cell wall biosynthesis